MKAAEDISTEFPACVALETLVDDKTLAELEPRPEGIDDRPKWGPPLQT